MLIIGGGKLGVATMYPAHCLLALAVFLVNICSSYSKEPGRPTDLRVRETGYGLLISWKPPTDGGSVMSYDITYSTNGVWKTVASEVVGSSYLWRHDVIEETAYQFRVFANGMNGHSLSADATFWPSSGKQTNGSTQLTPTAPSICLLLTLSVMSFMFSPQAV